MLHILVKDFQRHIMLNRGVAIGDQRHVETEQRSTLGDRAHILLYCGGYNLLALVTAGLVVIFNAVRALRLQPADMRQRIGLAVDLRINMRAFRTIDDFACRKAARADDLASAHHFQRREDQRRTAGRIMTGGHAKREIDHLRPIGLRRIFIDAVRAMGMRIDQAGNDRLAADIDSWCTCGNCHFTPAAYRLDPVIFDQDNAILDRAAIGRSHGDQPRANQRDSAGRLVGIDAH